MSKISGKYTARQLLESELHNSKPLIDGLIYEDDAIMLVGREKANKSTLAMQMCVALSSCNPLFKTFKVFEPVSCVYIQAEGKLSNTKSNLQNMILALKCDIDNILFLYYPHIPLNKPDGLNQVIKDIDSWEKRPRFIVVDPLYQSMHGSLKDDDSAREMTGNLRALSARYHSAIVVVHHCHNPKHNSEGAIIDEGDNSIFGSFVWKAYPDAVIMIEKVKGHKDYRKLYCDTQRQGNVVTDLDLRLIEPSPYYLELRNESPIRSLILSILSSGNFSSEELALKISRSRQNVSTELNALLSEQLVSFREGEKNRRLWSLK